MGLAWSTSPAGSEYSILRFREAEVDSFGTIGVLDIDLALGTLRGVDSSSGSAKLSSVSRRVE